MKRRSFLQLFAAAPLVAALPAIAAGVVPESEAQEISARVLCFYDVNFDMHVWRIDAIDKSDGVQYTTSFRCFREDKPQALELVRRDFLEFLRLNNVSLANLYAPPAPHGMVSQGIVEVLA